MRFCTHVPRPPLDQFVRDFWLYENYTPADHRKERILPNGTIVLVINLQDDELRIFDPERDGHCTRFSGALVSGTYRRCFVTDTAEEKAVMGVQFRPGGAFPFFGMPPDELTGMHVDLESLWGRSARGLRERLCEARTPAARFQILEDSLSAHLAGPLEHHYAVETTLEAFGRPGARPMVREVSRHLGLSERRLIRVFAAEVGLTPKLFGRIQRFQRTIEAASEEDRSEPDWAHLAWSCGYCDQSHLISDFVEFSGFTPGAYARTLRSLRARGLRRKRNHVPLLS